MLAHHIIPEPSNGELKPGLTSDGTHLTKESLFAVGKTCNGDDEKACNEIRP